MPAAAADEPSLCPEADRIKSDADKKLKSFNLFSSQQKRMTEAAEMYARAAGKYRVAKLWEEAGEAHMLAAHNYKSAAKDEWVDARKNFDEAGKCFSKCKPEDAVEAFKLAAEMSVAESSFSMAAQYYKTIGELIEEEEMDADQAIQAFKNAAKYFEAEDSLKNATDMNMKIAFFYAKLESYSEATELYDKIIQSNHKGLSKSVGEIAVFNCVLCHLACKTSTVQQADTAMEMYKEMYPQFERSPNGKLLDGIFEAIRQNDIDAWDKAISSADDKNPISGFHRSMITQARQTKLEGGGGLDEEPDFT